MLMIINILQKYDLLPQTDVEDYLTDNGNLNLYTLAKQNKQALTEVNALIDRHSGDVRRLHQLIYDNNFLPVNCLQWIEKNHQHIYSHNKVHIVDNKPIDRAMIKHVLKIIRWIASISQKSPDIEVWIFLCPFKKELPPIKGKPLGRNEVNSGVTLLSPKEKWVQVFRREEVLKVLIHELFHYYELEIRDEADDIQKELGIDYLLNEAYNELLTIYCHTLYYSKMHNMDFMECYKKEIEHSKKMYYKILDYHGITKWEDMFNGKFKQKTNVFSYYILKYVLMTHHDILHVPDKRDIDKIRNTIMSIMKNYRIIPGTRTTVGEPSLRMSYHDII
jgi:hypothetical protein